MTDPVAQPTANGHRKVRILLADAHSLFREAVKVALDGEMDLEVISEARDGMQAVHEATRVSPDVALLDAFLPNCDGVRATELITAERPDCRVIILSDDDDPGVLIRGVMAGARGYLAKSSGLTELIWATRAVSEGKTRIPPRMLGDLLDRLIHRRSDEDEAIKRISQLTRREKEVLAILADGGDNDTIAETLVISPQTARTHVQNVLGKLDVHSRLEAAALARQDGILRELSQA